MSSPQSEAPTGLEYKSTEGMTTAEAGRRDAVFPLRHAPIPHVDRTGSMLNDDEVKSAYAAVGSPAYGNDVQNGNVATLGAMAGNEVPVVGSDGVPNTRDAKRTREGERSEQSATEAPAERKTTARKSSAE